MDGLKVDGLPLKSGWVEALGFVLDAEVLESFPIAVGSDGAQGEHGLGAGDFPTHAAAFHAVAVFHSVFGQMAAGAFDHAGGEVFVVLQAVQVGFQEPGQRAELDLGRAGESALRALAAQIGDDRLGLSLQAAQQAASDERDRCGAGFLVEQMRRVGDGRLGKDSRFGEHLLRCAQRVVTVHRTGPDTGSMAMKTFPTEVDSHAGRS